MAKKLSVKFKIIIAVLIAAVLCVVSALVFRFAVYQPDNLVFRGQSMNVSLSKERKKDYHMVYHQRLLMINRMLITAKRCFICKGLFISRFCR